MVAGAPAGFLLTLIDERGLREDGLAMPIDSDTSQAPQRLRWTLTGKWPGIGELQAVRQQLVAEGHLTPQTRALFDIRYVENVPSYSDVSGMIEAAVKAGGLPLKRAYLVGSAEQYGIVQQMKALAPAGIAVEIFFSEPEALSWLAQGA